jgi:hypothetical protein
MLNRKVWLLVRGDIFCQGLKLYLEQWGLQVADHPFRKGIAPELNGRQQPALIIMDYKAKFSSHEAALLTSGHTIPVLFMVSHSQDYDALSRQVKSVSYYCCLPKPCPISALQKAVENLLGVPLSPEAAPEEVVAPFPFPLPEGIVKKVPCK